jgi:hypothetical protein
MKTEGDEHIMNLIKNLTFLTSKYPDNVCLNLNAFLRTAVRKLYKGIVI